MKRPAVVAAAVVIALGVAAGGFWYWMGQPLYTPGMASAGTHLRAPLTAPAQSGNAGFDKNMKRLEQTLGVGAQLADIKRIWGILGGGKLTLIGHSFGGFLAALCGGVPAAGQGAGAGGAGRLAGHAARGRRLLRLD